MNKKWKKILALALALLCLSGCKETGPEETTAAVTEAPETVPPTVPPDGNPDDVTCQGSYTAEGAASAVVATVNGAELTNGVLSAYYWAAAADYRAQAWEISPDFERPLDTQPCAIDSSVNSWQQYFLRQALNNWHSAVALKLQGDAEGLEADPAYQPNLDNHAIYLKDVPAMKYHTSYNLESYHPNTLHQNYLDELPAMLEDLAVEKGYADAASMAREAFGTTLSDLLEAAEIYNRGYMYFTTLSYDAEPSQEELDAYFTESKQAYTQEGKTVDLRHILLVPDGSTEAAWAAELEKAEGLLNTWRKEWHSSEGGFAQLARYNSEDPGSTVTGGVYWNIRQGQLMQELDEWCFDNGRMPGDTTILRSEYGYHILYFSGSSSANLAQAREDMTVQRQGALVTAARQMYPMDVRYDAIVLTEGTAAVSGSGLLYPDIAHERFPETPVFLQQDYGGTLFGGDLLRTNGCGITTFSMLSSYMTDEENTPPEMCARYGNYSYQGTDGRLFQLESPALGFFCKEKTYDPKVAKKALEEGYPVVSLQHKGYWTRGGHYLLVEKMNEDGTVQVRDSNIFNYGKLDGHKEDRFKWSLIPANGSAFWIFEKKVTAVPACSRCGAPEGVTQELLKESYICEKCTAALLRRGTYQTACGQ